MAVNRILCLYYGYRSYYRDYRLEAYIKSFENQTDIEPFKAVTFAGLQNNCGAGPTRMNFCRNLFGMQLEFWDERVTDWQNDWNKFREETDSKQRRWYCLQFAFNCVFLCWVAVIGWITIPLYICSRIFHLIFPLIVIGYVCYSDLWFEVALLQYLLLLIYVSLVLLLCWLSIYVLELHHAMMFLAPGQSKYIARRKDIMLSVNQYYNGCVSIKVKVRLLSEKFGKDIATIICTYISRFDDAHAIRN
jgi:hypothetical protein